MKNKILFSLLLSGVTANAYAAENVSYGKIVEVNPPKKEIYILADDGGTRIEYYFNKTTTVHQKGDPKRFEDLSVGQRVRVTADKIGKRFDPKNVEILD